MKEKMRRHFDWASANDALPRRLHRQMVDQMRHLIPKGSRVLEVGCGKGELLRALRPKLGLGIDMSPRILEAARAADNDACIYEEADAATYSASQPFDYIVMDYLVGYLPDVQAVFENMLRSAHPRTRLCLSSLNTLWAPILGLGALLGLATRQARSNWLSSGDLANLLALAGWEVVHSSTEQMLPFRVPLLGAIANRFLVRLPILRHCGSTLSIVARPVKLKLPQGMRCSVIVPVRNEAGTIREALRRIPVLGSGTELVFVEGGSRDGTWEAIQREVSRYSGPLTVHCCRQAGKGKWDAVRTGFKRATGDVVVVQDGDLTAPPEDLPKFFEAVSSGSAEFANGSRLVYPMESEAMRFLNLLGNKCFALALSYTLGQPIKDSLCGTKMLLRSDCLHILERVEELGDFDPFGDFNLLFGASLLQLKIRDVPLRYESRSYGSSNISRFWSGWRLLKMTMFGLLHLKFGRA